MKISCDRARELMDERLDQLESEKSSRNLDEHLSGCLTCQSIFDDLNRAQHELLKLNVNLDDIIADVDVPKDFVSIALERWNHEQQVPLAVTRNTVEKATPMVISRNKKKLNQFIWWKPIVQIGMAAAVIGFWVFIGGYFTEDGVVRAPEQFFQNDPLIQKSNEHAELVKSQMEALKVSQHINSLEQASDQTVSAVDEISPQKEVIEPSVSVGSVATDVPIMSKPKVSKLIVDENKVATVTVTQIPKPKQTSTPNKDKQLSIMVSKTNKLPSVSNFVANSEVTPLPEVMNQAPLKDINFDVQTVPSLKALEGPSANVTVQLENGKILLKSQTDEIIFTSKEDFNSNAMLIDVKWSEDHKKMICTILQNDVKQEITIILPD